MKKKIHAFLHDNKGTSLVELVLYIAISSIILVDLTGIISQVVHTQVQIEALASEDENARTLMRLISESVEAAATINSPNAVNATTSTLNLTDESSPANTVIYSLTSGIVYKQINSNAAVAITSNAIYVTSLQFTVESEGGVAPSINIQVNIQQSQNNSLNLTHYETTAAQRTF